MASVPTRVLLSGASAISGLPTLSFLLAGLGILLLGAAMAELAGPVHPGDPAATSPAMAKATTAQAAAPEPLGNVPTHLWGGAWSSIGDPGFARRVRAPESSLCLGADLAAGRRAESAHRATVPLQDPGDCGDLRQAFKATAVVRAARHGSAAADATRAAADRPGPDSDDRMATALFGPALRVANPPDRWDARWDLFAADERWRCPCPVYPIDAPHPGPR